MLDLMRAWVRSGGGMISYLSWTNSPPASPQVPGRDLDLLPLNIHLDRTLTLDLDLDLDLDQLSDRRSDGAMSVDGRWSSMRVVKKKATPRGTAENGSGPAWGRVVWSSDWTYERAGPERAT